MPRTAKTVSVSLSPEMAEQIELVMREEGCAKSELIRKALRRYLTARHWRSLTRYGQARAQEFGIKPDDVESLIDESRAEKRQTGTEVSPEL